MIEDSKDLDSLAKIRSLLELLAFGMKELSIKLVLVFADVEQERASWPDEAAVIATMLGGQIVDCGTDARWHL